MTRLASPRVQAPGLRAGRGFTLIELIVSLALLGVLMAVAVPSFRDAALGNRLSSVANGFVASVQLARGEAIKRNLSVKMCRSSDGVNCAASGGWEVGWITFIDADNDNILDTAETLIHKQAAVPSDMLVATTAGSLVFRGTGLLDGAAEVSFKVCQASPSPGAQDRVLTIGATGRPSVKKDTSGTCAAAT